MNTDYIAAVKPLVEAALKEDIGPGDLTSLACLEPNSVTAAISAKSKGVLSGVIPVLLAFDIVDSANTIRPLKQDGDSFDVGDIIFEIEGFNQTVLTSERTALNFLGRLSGVATYTSRFVDKIKHTNCKILDTRKTTPGWRLLEKKAVAHGGGVNHRIGLYDMVLIKDNHIASAGSITNAVEQTRDFLDSPEFRIQFKTKKEAIDIEVEVTNAEQLQEAIHVGIKRILLDNQSPGQLKELVKLSRELDEEVLLEASGNVNIDNVASVAESGVDFISIGALTHSAVSSDFSLNLKES